MTAPIRQRVPLPASDEAADARRGAAGHDRAMAIAGVLPAKPRHAGRGLIPLPRLSAHDHDDVTVVRLRGELDLSGTAVAQAQLRDTRWQARLHSVADLTGLFFPGCAFLGVPARRGKPIRERAGNVALGGPQAAAVRAALPVIGMLAWFEAHGTIEHAVTGTGAPRSPVFPATPPSLRSPLAAQQRAPAPSSALPELHSASAEQHEQRRHVQPRQPHDRILGAHQRAVILPPCPTSGRRRGTF